MSTSTCWSSAAASPARRGARRGDPRVAHRARRTARLRFGHLVEVVQARARRAPLPPAERDRASSTRRSPSGSACASTAPHLVRCCPSSSRSSPATASSTRRSPGPSARRCGCTTSPAALRIGKLHKRLDAGRGARAHADAAAPTGSRRRTSTTTRTPTTPASRSRSPATAAATVRRSPTTPPSRPGEGQRRHGDRRDGRGRRHRARRAGAGRRERHRRVGRRRARSTRARTRDSIRPAKGIHITVPWAEGAERHRRGDPRARRTGGRCSSCHGASSTVHRHHRHRLRRPARRPAVHARRHRVRAAGAQRIGHDRRHRGRHPRHVGRAAAAACKARRASAPPTCRAATRCAARRAACVTVTGGKLTTYRRMAADTVDEVAELLDVRRRSSHQARCSCSAVTGSTRPADGGSARRPPRAAATARRARRSTCWPRAIPTSLVRSCAGLPYVRAEAVHAVRHEMARTLDDVPQPAHSGAAARPRRCASRRPTTWPRSMAPELGWDRRRAPAARSPPTVDAVTRERTRTGCPDSTRRDHRGMTPSRRSPSKASVDSPRPHIGARRVEVGDATRRRLRDACAAVVTERRESRRPAATGGRWPMQLGARGRGRRGLASRRCQARRRRRGGRDPRRLQRRPRDARHRGRRDAAACAARACPCTAASCSTCCALAGIVDVDDDSLVLDVLPGTFGDAARGGAARRRTASRSGTGPQSVALSTVGGWLACRRRGPATRRATERSRTWSWASTSCSPTAATLTTGGAPAPPPGPDLTQLFVGSRGHPRRDHGRRLRVHPAPRRGTAAMLELRLVRATASSACRRILRRGATPAVLRLYDDAEAESQLPDRRPPRAPRATTRATPRDRRRSDERSSPRSARWPASARRRASSTGGSTTATTSARSRLSPVRASSSTRWRSRLAGVTSRRSTAQLARAIISVPGAAWPRRPTSRHAYTDGACLYFTFAGRPPAEQRRRSTSRRGMRARGPCSANGGAVSHHHGVGLNRSPVRARGPRQRRSRSCWRRRLRSTRTGS